MSDKVHPKVQIEVMEDTRSAIEGYAATQKISLELSAQILILNELRCLHWHKDMELASHAQPERKV